MTRRRWLPTPFRLPFRFTGWRRTASLASPASLARETAVEGTGPVMIIAPHPDDESLAAGGLIQQALDHGRQVQVVIVTNGDGYRVAAERRRRWLRLERVDMVAFGRLRRQETLAATGALGLAPEQVSFLGYPDRGLAAMWQTHWTKPYRSPYTRCESSPYRTGAPPFTGQAFLAELIRLLDLHRPSLVVYPHPLDAHPDHWAIHNFTTAALEELRSRDPHWYVRERLYLIHRGNWPAPRGLRPTGDLLPPGTMADGSTAWSGLALTPEQVRRKEQAIRQHRSQVAMMGRYLLSFARTGELFGRMEPVVLAPQREPENTWVLVTHNPVRDTLARGLIGAADIAGLEAIRAGDQLKVRVRLRATPRTGIRYLLSIHGFDESRGWSDQIRLNWHPGARTPDAEAVGSTVEFKVALDRLDQFSAILLGSETYVNRMMADRAGGRLVKL